MNVADAGFFAIAPDEPGNKHNHKKNNKNNPAGSKHGANIKLYEVGGKNFVQ